MEDYLSVLSYARSSFPCSRIVLYAHSLGGAAACCVLASLPVSHPRLVDALILENAFPSVPRMITHSLYPSRLLPYHYLSPLALDTWDALSALQKPDTLLARTPTLFVSGAEDSLVKPSMVREMYECKPGESRKGWLSVREASHDDCWTKGDWWKGVRAFLNE